MTAANTVSARQPRLIAGTADHDRDNQRHFDHRDRHREHQGPERLADPMRDHFRVVDCGEHRKNQTCPGHGGKNTTHAADGRSRQNHPSEQRPHPSPPRHPFRRRH
jgi:hypothetical protein